MEDSLKKRLFVPVPALSLRTIRLSFIFWWRTVLTRTDLASRMPLADKHPSIQKVVDELSVSFCSTALDFIVGNSLLTADPFLHRNLERSKTQTNGC